MKLLLVLCIIGLVGSALAMPGVFRERMAREFRNVKSVSHVSKHPLTPLHVFRNQLSKSAKSASLRKKTDCELCPPPNDMKPCTCTCDCIKTKCLASIYCSSALEERSELERILSLESYPVRNYGKLVVAKTFLDGSITRDLLGTTVTFEEININNNGFTSVDTKAFNYTGPELRRLILNNNQIFHMDELWDLKEIPNIQYMDISHNKIGNIPSYTMESKDLHFLNFSHNDIQFVGDSAFKGLPKLTRLDLSRNALMMLQTNMLAFNNHEDVPLSIDISHNLINYIQIDAISGVQKLTLDLRYNTLESLDEEIFRNFIDSTNASIHINVTGNPIVCDCFLLWVVQNSTVSNCFDDFPVCDSTIKNVTTENLGDCGQNKTTAAILK